MLQAISLAYADRSGASRIGFENQHRSGHTNEVRGLVLHLITALLAAIRVFFRSRLETSLEVLALRQGRRRAQGKPASLIAQWI